MRGVNVGQFTHRVEMGHLLDKLQNVTLHITRDANVVNKRQVDLRVIHGISPFVSAFYSKLELCTHHILAQSYATGVRADWYTEFGRHEQNREDLIDTSQSTRVDLTNVNSIKLQQLLEDHLSYALF